MNRFLKVIIVLEGQGRACLAVGVLGCPAGQDDVIVARSYQPSAQRKCGGSLMIFIASAQAASDDWTSTAAAIIGATIGAVAVITVGVLSYFTQRKQLREQGAQFRRQLDDTEQQLYVLREGQITDRCLTAASQPGDKSSPVRIDGVYALERIGHDSSKDLTTIIYLLDAFIRERSMITRKRPDDLPEDVQAGLRVVGRLRKEFDARLTTLNLRDADLRYANLSSLREEQVSLEGACS